MSFLAEPIKAFASWIEHPFKKRVVMFSEGSAHDVETLSIKGANLCEMAKNKSLRVPPGFVVSCAASMEFSGSGSVLAEGLVSEYTSGVFEIERATGQVFGSTSATAPPLLLCVRGGALIPLPRSHPFYLQAFNDTSESQFLPGMHRSMVVGLNEEVVNQLSSLTSRRLALRLYAHFLLTFGTSVYDVPMERYNAVLADIRKMTGHAVVWTEQDFETMCREFKAIQTPPDDVWVQLRLVLCKLYSSWFSDQAVAYRVALGFPKELGTAAIVQQYIAGDHGYLSTRSTSGDSQDIQGCLVKGATERRVDLSEVPGTKMRAQLLNAKAELEWMFKDMQDVEFAVDPADEVIHVTQSKPGHRNAKANLKIAVSMASERVITERQAVMQVDPLKLEHYLRDHIEIEDFRTSGEHVVIARGTVGASAGCVSGVACFSSAACLTIEDCNLILITDDCVLDDVPAIKAATAIITKCGSPSCEAAVLCRGLGKPCLVLASPLVFDYDREGKICGAICGKHRVNEGDILFVDSDAGEVYIGYSHPGFASNDPDLAAVLGWADKSRRVLILGDAESCAESTFGLNCGAQGVGNLDLTFNTSVVLEYLVSRSAADKQEKLRCLENYLKAQYAKILRGYHKKRVTVRLFDGSMSDFLPSSEEEAALVGSSLNLAVCEVKAAMYQVKSLYTTGTCSATLNAMLFPELVQCQLAAFFDAILSVRSEGTHVYTTISLSGVDNVTELDYLTGLIDRVMDTCTERAGLPMSVNPALSLVDIGIVVSTPQQCLRSHEFCSRLAYLCFDLERLTELAMGANPFTCSKIVAQYMQRGLIKENPFKAVDDFCVGTLMKQCIEECKRVNPEMKFGAYCGSNYVCSRSLYYLHGMRVDFISCDPFKVPIARLVLAQAQIDEFAPEKTYELDPDSLRKDSGDTRADEVLDDWTVFF